MADLSPLVVPISLKALAVNDNLRENTEFQRWTLGYSNIPRGFSPEPAPFSGLDLNFATQAASNGVYLHWTLPAALRKGQVGDQNNTVAYPLVPNRWFVMRYSGPVNGRLATAWIVESDYNDNHAGTASFMNPTRTSPVSTRIGRKIDITQATYVDSSSASLFLTAMAPGEPAFAAYQPYCENVFSLHDTLDGVQDGELLSYLVVGWYSQASSDLLADWQGMGFQEYLASLNWTARDASTNTAATSVYEGMVFGIPWSTTDRLTPAGQVWPIDPTETAVAIGNSSIDALTAFIQRAEDEGVLGSFNPALLEAFQYGLLDELSQVDGPAILEQKIVAAWFRSHQGGFRWALNPLLKDDVSEIGQDAPPTQAAMAAAQAALDQLNTLQSQYDDAIRLLAAQQVQLYETWWKSIQADNIDYPSGTPSESWFTNQLRAGGGGIMDTVIAQTSSVASLQASIPYGETPEALAASLQSFLGNSGISLPSGYELRQYASHPYQAAGDPVIMVSGLKASGLLDSGTALACRFANQLVTGFNYNGSSVTTATLNHAITSLSFTNLPAITSSLVNEFFFLDPTNAGMVNAWAFGGQGSTTAIASAMADHLANDIGQVPMLDLGLWEQPWSPLFLQWEVTYYPIDYQTNGNDNWNFDGTSFSWSGQGTTAKTVKLSGRAFLSPQSCFNFKARLEQYLAGHPEPDLAAIEDFIDAVEDWDFLSQSLDGFTAGLTMRSNLISPGPYQSGMVNGQTLAEWVGNGPKQMPILGNPQATATDSKFQLLRSGQMTVSKLTVVDRFGQTAQLISDGDLGNAEWFHPILGYGLKPTTTVSPVEPYRFTQLPPRLLQAGRLDFDLLLPNGAKAQDQANANPILGWVMPNHLNRSLAIYDPTGQALGEISIHLDGQDQRALQWNPVPGGLYSSYTDFQTVFPTLYNFIANLFDYGTGDDSLRAFENLVQVVDESLWTINPFETGSDNGLSVLCGRPLALIDASLQFKLEGPAVNDPSWCFTQTGYHSALPAIDFRIRLGDLEHSQDGLIGYFLNGQYDQFYSVHYPKDGSYVEPTAPYIHQIGPGNFIRQNFSGTRSVKVTMLVDPRAVVHAYTGILPVTMLHLPDAFVSPVLARLQLNFRIGPLLATTTADEDGTNVTLQMPIPTESNGTWSWLDGLTAGNQTLLPMQGIDQQARFSNRQLIFRNGVLMLQGALAQ